jgi:hypothetical protein
VSNAIHKEMFTTKFNMYGNYTEAYIALMFLIIRERLQRYGVILCAPECATHTVTIKVMLRVLITYKMDVCGMY